MIKRMKMGSDGAIKAMLEDKIKNNNVMIFSKTTCPFCKKVKELLDSLKVEYSVLEMNLEDNMTHIQSILHEISGQKTVPNVYINSKHVGGHDDTVKAHKEGHLLKMINEASLKYDYDVIVIGGGSGGLSASKTAAQLGKKAAVLDFVKPTPKGTTWGLGGTCVNVGCIPKKLMHQASMLGKSIKDSKPYGWDVNTEAVKLSWSKMIESVQDYIGSLNWGYRVQLRDKDVNYVNSYAQFEDKHTITATNRRGKQTKMTAEKFIIAVGERPKYPEIPGAKEYGITSDDLFSLPYCPGKTLVVGASYVALECGGFLKGIGLDVTIMIRSIFLRGFDQQMAEKIGEYMEQQDEIKMLKRCIPLKVEKVSDGEPGLLRVTAKNTETDEVFSGDYNTVIFAIGRESVTKNIGLETVGLVSDKNGKIAANDVEQTAVPNIYAIGDNLLGKPELTPVAIQAGKLLAQRLFSDSTEKCDYINVATTVFTPLEYSCCGLAEEVAEEKFGEDNLEVYHSNFWPLEWTLPAHDANICYAKVITNKLDNERIVGMHYLGPNAGEVMQGFAAAMKCGMTKRQLDSTIGIHPTTAEIFTTLTATKRSGGDIGQAGC